MVCNNCNKSYTVLTGYRIEDYSEEEEYPDLYICSPSCLVEHAWMIKENQEKLSKSKI